MDSRLSKIIHQKINQILQDKNQLDIIRKSLVSSENDDSFIFGIVVGRMYNSFYYQCRRILDRDPTREEFTEFITILQENKSRILDSI